MLFTLIVRINLSLQCQVFVDSVNSIVHIYDIKKYANISLSTTERNSKVTSVAHFIPRKFWCLSQEVSKLLCSHPIKDSSACFTLPCTLQLYYKPLGILQTVTKSQKFNISNDNGFPNFTILTLLEIGSSVSQSSSNTSFPEKMLNLSSNRCFILWPQSSHKTNICRKPSFPMKVSLIVRETKH